jgi:predicted TIM-barrel fold metal-dependent hydrolase
MESLEQIARLIAPLGWHVQLLLDGRDLPELAPRLRALPVPFVIDHMGHMPAQLGLAHPGFATLLALVREGNCWVKLSGAYRITSKYPYEEAASIAKAHPSFQGAMPVDATLLDLLASWVPDPLTFQRILTRNPAELYDFVE